MPAPEPGEKYGIEKRNTQRQRCSVPIEIDWGAVSLRGNVVDITRDGLFVEVEQPLWIGARFSAELELDQRVGIECVVRRVEPFRGMALTYTIPDETGQAVVASYLEQLSKR